MSDAAKTVQENIYFFPSKREAIYLSRISFLMPSNYCLVVFRANMTISIITKKSGKTSCYWKKQVLAFTIIV